MNATSIWAGNDYAFIPNKRRGERFSLEAHRVKVRRVLKETRAGNSKASTFVEVQFVDCDTGEPIEYTGWSGIVDRLEGGTYKVRAYDFVDFWENVHDQYLYMVKKRDQEKQEREQRTREAQAERTRLEEERQHRLNQVKTYLLQKGVDPDWIMKFNFDGYGSYDRSGVHLSFAKIEASMQQERERRSGSLYDVAKGSEQG